MHPLQKLIERYRLVLASKSPRRHEILGKLDLPFEVRVEREIEEDYPHFAPHEMHKISAYLADKKNRALRPQQANNEIFITADTVVIHNGKHLEKPQSPQEAQQMLTSLQGSRHAVYTGVAVWVNDGLQEPYYQDNVLTWVDMLPMSDTEIAYYVERYKPFDKAGAYGVQEWFGAAAIKHLDGCHYNVMGLPIANLYEIFRRINSSLCNQNEG